jgi:hypothetical protein
MSTKVNNIIYDTNYATIIPNGGFVQYISPKKETKV